MSTNILSKKKKLYPDLIPQEPCSCLRCEVVKKKEVENKPQEYFFPEKFWMLYVEGASSPTTKHHTETEAKKEAERLAKTTRKRVHVLEMTSFCEISEAPIFWTNKEGTKKNV